MPGPIGVTKVAARRTNHPGRRKRIRLGDNVNDHMIGVNPDRHPRGASSVAPGAPSRRRALTPRSGGAPPRPPYELEETAGRSIGIDTENVIVHIRARGYPCAALREACEHPLDSPAPAELTRADSFTRIVTRETRGSGREAARGAAQGRSRI